MYSLAGIACLLRPRLPGSETSALNIHAPETRKWPSEARPGQVKAPRWRRTGRQPEYTSSAEKSQPFVGELEPETPDEALDGADPLVDRLGGGAERGGPPHPLSELDPDLGRLARDDVEVAGLGGKPGVADPEPVRAFLQRLLDLAPVHRRQRRHERLVLGEDLDGGVHHRLVGLRLPDDRDDFPELGPGLEQLHGGVGGARDRDEPGREPDDRLEDRQRRLRHGVSCYSANAADRQELPNSHVEPPPSGDAPRPAR